SDTCVSIHRIYAGARAILAWRKRICSLSASPVYSTSNTPRKPIGCDSHTTSHNTPARRWRLKDGVSHEASESRAWQRTLQEADVDVLSSGSTVDEGWGLRGECRASRAPPRTQPFIASRNLSCNPYTKTEGPWGVGDKRCQAQDSCQNSGIHNQHS